MHILVNENKILYKINFVISKFMWNALLNLGREYSVPWDAMKQVGCYCDAGYRGPACELQECPSGPDPIDGYVPPLAENSFIMDL